MDERERCHVCKTEIDWDGADEQRGELWSCEQPGCGDTFCVQCFKDRHGFEVWDHHINHTSIETGVMCPECFDKQIIRA